MAIGLAGDAAAVPRVQGVYHTHTGRCQHAEGDVPDYARAAAAAGLARLGASDHTPLPDGRWAGVRMRLDELPGYEAAVHEARSAAPGLHVLLGMECDIDAGYLGWYRDTFAARGYDYLIASVHAVDSDGREVNAFGCAGDPAALRDYARRIELAAASGLFAFIAHPDNIVSAGAAWTADTAAFARDVCTAATAHGIPLELNSLGLRERRGYPWRPFWEVAAAHGCAVVLSTDAHQPRNVAAGLDELADLAAGLGLRVVDPVAGRAGESRPWT